MSQREVAKRTGDALTAAYISRIEGDARTPTVDAVWMLADAIGCDRQWLRTGSDQPDDDTDVLSALRAENQRLRAQLVDIRRILD